MRRSAWISAGAVLAALSVFWPPAAMAETISIAGSGSAHEFLHRAIDAFTRRTGIQVENVQNLASSGSMRAVTDGVIDIAVSAQSPTDAQKAAGLRQVLSLRTPFVLVTSHPDPQNLTGAQIVKAYASGGTWSDGMPIRIVLRPEQSPDIALMKQFFPGLTEALAAARLRPDIPVTALDPDNARLAEVIPGSLAGMALLQAMSEKRKLHFVAIDGVQPTWENFEGGRYTYAKPLSFYLPAKAKPAAEQFVDFVRSPEGRDLFRQAHGVE
jgi:phosphate transport system substrate-binding protein